MDKPTVIRHMVVSLDGKVTGKFLENSAAQPGIEEYYRLHREFQADAFACGRVTMESSFTHGWYPDLTPYASASIEYTDYVAAQAKFYAVAFDRQGRLGWQNSMIVDEDSGYNGAHIVEILTEQADRAYLAYLRKMGISYLFAGQQDIDVQVALRKLKQLFGIETLLLEGGSVINGAFQRAGQIDALSLVVVPLLGDKDDKALMSDSCLEVFAFKASKVLKQDTLWLTYQKGRKS